MKLFVTRHGETDWNKERRVQGHTDIELNAEGIEQAEKLANRLKNEKIEVIYSSPLKRALRTAQEIQKYHPDAKLILEDDLKEICFGVIEGKIWPQAIVEFKKDFEEREKNKYLHSFKDGETYTQVEKRVQRVLDKILKSGKETIIVSHGTANKFILKKLLKQTIQEIEKPWYHNTSLSIFEINGEDVVVEAFNCGKHLDKIEARPRD